jgi:hypothetical protein
VADDGAAAPAVGTSQASARSSTLRQSSPKGAVMPLRAKVTSGPRPGGPAGWCGGLLACPVIPGLRDGSAPNSSVWIAAGPRPNAVRAPRMSAMNDVQDLSGPQIAVQVAAGDAIGLLLDADPVRAACRRRGQRVAADRGGLPGAAEPQREVLAGLSRREGSAVGGGEIDRGHLLVFPDDLGGSSTASIPPGTGLSHPGESLARPAPGGDDIEQNMTTRR